MGEQTGTGGENVSARAAEGSPAVAGMPSGAMLWRVD
jgi:hypothetical protein